MPQVSAVLDLSQAGGSGDITEHRGPGTLQPPYVLAPIKTFLQQRGAADITPLRAWLSQRGAADVDSIKNFLQQRGVASAIVNELDGFVQGLPFLNELQAYATGTVMQTLVNDLDTFVSNLPLPNTQLISQGTDNGMNLHSTLVSDTEAEVVLFTDLSNSTSGKAYNMRLQVRLDRDSVQKINNFTYFLLTLLP